MLSLTLAARGFHQLQRCAAAARCLPPLPAPPATRGHATRAMAATAQDGQSVDEQKRRVREEVKAALRALSTEQMAAESEQRLVHAEGMWETRRGSLAQVQCSAPCWLSNSLDCAPPFLPQVTP